MLFLRQIRHLLPDGLAWRAVVDKTLRRYLVGLTAGLESARTFADSVWGDLFPETTRELTEWEVQFGLFPTTATTTEERQAALDAAWKAQGGQSPAYIQGVLHAAGFPGVFIHEWWASTDPWVARDPRDYTTHPLIGTFQCSGFPSQPQCMPIESGTLESFQNRPQCNRFLVNNPGYLVNLDLTPRPPPPVPDDPQYWPYFIYFGTEVFGGLATVPNHRKAEFERLVLKLCPTQHWIVLMVDYITDGVFDHTFDPAFE